MDRIEGERRAARRPEDQPETEGSRASRRRSVTVRSGRLICKKDPAAARLCGGENALRPQAVSSATVPQGRRLARR